MIDRWSRNVFDKTIDYRKLAAINEDSLDAKAMRAKQRFAEKKSIFWTSFKH